MSKEVGSFKVGNTDVPVFSYKGEVVSTTNSTGVGGVARCELWIKADAGKERSFVTDECSAQKGDKVTVLFSEDKGVTIVLAVVNHSGGTASVNNAPLLGMGKAFGFKGAAFKAYLNSVFKWALFGLPLLILYFMNIKILGDGPMVIFVLYELFVPFFIGGIRSTTKFTVNLSRDIEATVSGLASQVAKDTE